MKISANRADTEPERLSRLERVAKALELSDFAANVRELHDDKGTLYVDWKSQPTTAELSAAILAWKAENEPLSNHYVQGRPLVWDVGGSNPFGGPKH